MDRTRGIKLSGRFHVRMAEHLRYFPFWDARRFLPSLESLLLETPEEQRFGWIFNPMSLQTKLGRRVRHQRPDAEWVGKVISRIGP